MTAKGIFLLRGVWFFLGVGLGCMSAFLALGATHLLGQGSSMLTRDLPGEWTKGSAEFDRRLRERFPIGTPYEDFIRELVAQNFQPQWPDPQSSWWEVSRDESSFVCNIKARVYFRVDLDGKLSSISGKRREEGCL
jgi:hypothetical protein